VVDFLGRSDLGIKLLSLETAGAITRAEAAVDGPGLPADASLREAVSFMAVHGVMRVNVVGRDAMHVGVLHAADIFSRAALDPAT
jgi:osmoprotectant transport system ATP-binding protein